MSASAEQLLERLQKIADELDAWAAGERSSVNLIPVYASDAASMAQRESAVASMDAATITMLSAQMTATVALIQLTGDQPTLSKVWWEGYRAAAQDNKITDPETEFVPNPYEPAVAP